MHCEYVGAEGVADSLQPTFNVEMPLGDDNDAVDREGDYEVNDKKQ